MLGFASVSELPISALPAGAPAAPADPPDGKQSTRTAPEPLRNAGAAFVLGSALALLSAGPAPTPVRPYEALLAPQVQKKFDVVNTSQGTPATLTNVTVVPRLATLSPQKLPPAFLPAASAPNLLVTTLGVVDAPSKNVFLAAPERARDVVSTAAGTPKAIYADSTLPAGQSTLLNPERLRDVVSTAASTPATLAPPGEVTPPEPPPAEDELPGGIENTARPNVRIKGLTGAAPAPFAPRPMAGELPSPTVEQLTPVVARVRPASAAPVARAAARLGEIPAARPAAAAGAAKALPPAPRFRTLPALWAFPIPATAAPQVRPAAPALVSDPALERAALDAENARIAAELALRLLGD